MLSSACSRATNHDAGLAIAARIKVTRAILLAARFLKEFIVLVLAHKVIKCGTQKST
jgi:hypothetical protein